VCNLIKHAAEVEIATYQYDNTTVQQMLLQRLRGRKPFKVNIYIDQEMLEGSTPRKQWSCLSELDTFAKAQMFVCTGRLGMGSFHPKPKLAFGDIRQKVLQELGLLSTPRIKKW